MVDCGGLENRYTLTGIVGSNPTASANFPEYLTHHSFGRTPALSVCCLATLRFNSRFSLTSTAVLKDLDEHACSSPD